MTATFAGFSGMFVKEVKELGREKRLFAILLVLGLVLSLPFSFFLASAARYGGYIPSPDDIVIPLTFILPIALIVVSLTFAADCVSKEKDSGMLGLVLSSPVTTEGFLAAKVAGTMVAYGAVAAFVLVFVGMIALSWGWVLLKLTLWLFLVPLLALWVFLVGLALLVSVVMNNSKTAVGVGIAVYLPLFLLSPMFLGELIRMVAPRAYAWLDYNPIAVAIEVAGDISRGAPFRWVPILTTVGAGLVFGAIAYALFRRQEVAS